MNKKCFYHFGFIYMRGSTICSILEEALGMISTTLQTTSTIANLLLSVLIEIEPYFLGRRLYFKFLPIYVHTSNS